MLGGIESVWRKNTHQNLTHGSERPSLIGPISVSGTLVTR